jgi:hypothetical protein
MTKLMNAAIAVAMISAVAAVGTASARTVTAIGGYPIAGPWFQCFSIDYTVASLTNVGGGSCIGTIIYEVGLPIDTTGAYAVQVTTKPRATPSAARCRTHGVSRDTTVNNFTAFVAATVPHAWQTLSIPAVTVPADGYLFVECDIPPSVRYNTISY